MSHHRSNAVRVPFPSSNPSTLLMSETPGPPLHPEESGPVRDPQHHPNEMFRPGSPSQHSPTMPWRAKATSPLRRSPGIDSIRALYRKYPNLFPQSSANSPPPNEPARAVGGAPNTSVSGPTRDPRHRPAASSRSANRSPGNENHAPTGFSHVGPADAATPDYEPTLMYPDFGPGFVSAENPTPNLALEIVSRPCDSEKWDLPSTE